jgi:hypothetical protein
MKRYHEEKHIIERRREEARCAYGWEPNKPGRYRKTHIGCNVAACQCCHPEKFPKRIPTRKEKQSQQDLNVTDT